MTVNNSDIAIIGMSGRFPGAKDIETFWENLREGVESISQLSDEELVSAGVDANLLNHPQYVKASGVLSDIDRFDASFFGFNARDAEMMDPQHRLFLEQSWEAIEGAGYNPETYAGSIGVYAGTGLNTYLLNNLYPNLRQSNLSASIFQILNTNEKDFLATQVSYKLKLTGPSISVQTACSTSLVAVHLAHQSLLNGECDLAIAGGVSIRVPQKSGYLYQEGMILSPDGHCRAFDAKAKGTIVGGGVGVVVLKRLEDALEDGDCIHAVIKGSAINNDGASKIGYTAPSEVGQTQVIIEAQGIAGIEPETISYIEAHGTGTVLGDPIEIAALKQAFGDCSRKKFCAIASVKTNIGHLDTAAGVAGLIKTILALKHKQLPPSLNFENPNPQIDLTNSPFYINNELRQWETNGTPRRAGVSSFGIGGTNAHLVLEEAPLQESSLKSSPYQLLVISAKTTTALNKATVNLAEYLKQNPQINLADVAYTLSMGRKAFDYRRSLVSRDVSEAVNTLFNPESDRVLSYLVDESSSKTVAFLFSGQGAQYINMGGELYQLEQTFREQIDRCSELLKPHLGLDLRQVIYPTTSEEKIEASTQLEQTNIAQPALFVIEYALAKLWMSWGVRPTVAIGHSIGEYVAACLAGVFSLEDALALIAIRSKLMQECEVGAMLAVPLPAEEIEGLLTSQLSLAAINGPSLCAVSGTIEAISTLEEKLASQGLECRRLHTSGAFHSQMMEPILESFIERVKQIKLSPPQLPYISNVTGTWITAEMATDPNYWAKHLRQTVQFSKGMKTLLQEPIKILLEVGPGQTLKTLALKHLDKTSERVVLSSLPHYKNNQSDGSFILNVLGQLWGAGVNIDWSGFYRHDRRYRLPLPTYPFERQSYWIDANSQVLPSKKPDIADWFYLPLWKQSTPVNLLERNADTISSVLVFVDECGLGSELVEQLELAGNDVIVVKIGSVFTEESDRLYTLNPKERDDYNRLVDKLRSRSPLPNKIIHLWNVTLDEENSSLLETVDRYQDIGFYSLLFLVQALGRHNLTDKLEIAVVHNGIQTVTGQEIIYPPKATLLGAIKIIPQEYPTISCRSIDVVDATKKGAELVIAEINSKTEDQIIAYRGTNRWIQSFEPIRIKEAIPEPSKLKQGGVYLITGGLGGVGFVLAEYLAKTVSAKLILIGRSAFPDRSEWQQWLSDPEDSISGKIRKVQELEKLGAEVLVIQGDIANLEQMKEAIASAKEQFGQIHGVIHAAGNPGRGIIGRKTREEAEKVLAPKVKGTLVLETLLKGEPLDFFVLISSISSFLGEFGQVDYTSANIFLDIFARDRVNQESSFVCAINWDTWQEVGMAVNTAVPLEFQELRAENLQSGILPPEGTEAFRRILGSGVTQVIVSTGDFNLRMQQGSTLKQFLSSKVSENASLSKPTHPRPTLSNPYLAPRNKSEQIIADIWQQLLGLEQVGIHDNFFELGGHSLLSTQVLSRMREALEVELPLDSLFTSPTIAGLAELVENKSTATKDFEQLNDREEIVL